MPRVKNTPKKHAAATPEFRNTAAATKGLENSKQEQHHCRKRKMSQPPPEAQISKCSRLDVEETSLTTSRKPVGSLKAENNNFLLEFRKKIKQRKNAKRRMEELRLLQVPKYLPKRQRRMTRKQVLKTIQEKMRQRTQRPSPRFAILKSMKNSLMDNKQKTIEERALYIGFNSWTSSSSSSSDSDSSTSSSSDSEEDSLLSERRHGRVRKHMS